jgi:hypothetical protein
MSFSTKDIWAYGRERSGDRPPTPRPVKGAAAGGSARRRRRDPGSTPPRGVPYLRQGWKPDGGEREGPSRGQQAITD